MKTSTSRAEFDSLVRAQISKGSNAFAAAAYVKANHPAAYQRMAEAAGIKTCSDNIVASAPPPRKPKTKGKRTMKNSNPRASFNELVRAKIKGGMNAAEAVKFVKTHHVAAYERLMLCANKGRPRIVENMIAEFCE